ncbi:MAG: nucleotidyltransferase family protein [Pirellulaceae bacterium]|nr:nucleotidyltransferase family protein [Pirellulaceae bacterium]
MSKQLLSPEFLLLTCCARYQLEPRQQALLERLTARPLDWQRVLAQAEFHGVLPLMYGHVGRRGIGPDQVREPLRVAARQTLARNMEFTAELGRLTERLQTQGVRFLWFKGPVAAEMCGSEIGLRSYSDLDLLIDYEAFPRCCDLLTRAGYAPQFPLSPPWLERQFRESEALHFFHASRPRAIDVHWQLSGARYSFAVKTRDVWPRAREVTLDNTLIPTLAVDDTLLYYCLHAAKHDWSRLKWLIDIAEIVRAYPQFDWQEAWLRWSSAHNPYLVGVGLKLAADLLEAPIPSEILASLPPDARFARVYDAALAELSNGYLRSPGQVVWPWRTPFYFGMTQARDRWRRLYDILVRPTPAEWQLCPLSWPWSGLYYLLRPLRLIARSVLRQLARFQAWAK